MPTGGDIPFMDPSRLRWETSPKSLLGQGSFGVVYCGTWHGAPVAIKVIKPSKMEPPSEEHRTAESVAMKQHRREVHRLRAVQNSYIIQYLGVFRGANPKDLFIVTEYMEGGSLYDWLSKMRARNAILDNRSFLQVARHMAYGLCHVHSQGFTHGDLKPQNVLLTEGFSFAETEDGHVQASLTPSAKAKIADFGLSRRLEGAGPVSLLETVTATADFGTGPCGTYLYMSPEAYKGIKYLTDYEAKAPDVYAYGLILFEMLSGLQSWGVENIRNPVQLHTLVQEGRRPDWGTRKASIDADYIHLVERCWSSDIDQRPTFDEINHELEHLDNKRKQTINQGSISGLPLKGTNLSSSTTSGKEDKMKGGVLSRENEAPSFEEQPSHPYLDTSTSISASMYKPSRSREDAPVITKVITKSLTGSQTAKYSELLPLDHSVAGENEIPGDTYMAFSPQEEELRSFSNSPEGFDTVVGRVCPVLRVQSGLIETPANPPLHIESLVGGQETKSMRSRAESEYLTSSQKARRDLNLLQSMVRVDVEPQSGGEQIDDGFAPSRQKTSNGCSLNEHHEIHKGNATSSDETYQSLAFQSQQLGSMRTNQDFQSVVDNGAPDVEKRIPRTLPQRLDIPSNEVRPSLQPISTAPRSGIYAAHAGLSPAFNDAFHFHDIYREKGAASSANSPMPNLEHLSNSGYRQQPMVADFAQVSTPTVQTHLNTGMPFPMPSHSNNANSAYSHWPRREHHAPNPVHVQHMVVTNSDSRNSELPDINSVFVALKSPNRQELLNGLWSYGQKRTVAAGLARAKFLCGKEMLELASYYLDQSKGLKQDELEPLVARDLCICIGNIAQNQCETLAEDVVLKVVRVTLSTMFNLFTLFCNNINSAPAAFSACNFALCNLLRVHNKVRDPEVRSSIAEWISFWISFSDSRLGQGPSTEALSYTAISAARNFVWMNRENLIAFIEKSHRDGMYAVFRLLRLVCYFDWVKSVPSLEASLSALAVTIVMPMQQLEFVNCHGVAKLLKVLNNQVTNAKVARLVFAMLALILSGPAPNESCAGHLRNDFLTDNGCRTPVDAMNQMVQNSMQKEELVHVLEAGCSVLLMMTRFCERLRVLVVDFGAPKLVVRVASRLLAWQVTEFNSGVGARNRLCMNVRELIEELSKVPTAAQYFRECRFMDALRR